jgi:hypothetical protein
MGYLVRNLEPATYANSRHLETTHTPSGTGKCVVELPLQDWGPTQGRHLIMCHWAGARNPSYTVLGGTTPSVDRFGETGVWGTAASQMSGGCR